MLLLKLTIVPLFIVLVTLAGRKWGTQVAGLLGGMPVVAGPIVVLLALEQGQQFGVHAATSAMAGVAALLTFGIAYCWLSLRYAWPIAFAGGVLCWLVMANVLVMLPESPHVSLLVATAALLIAPKLLPNVSPTIIASTLKDLPLRMIAGALLTLIVTQSAVFLGGNWSGILAVFPVIGSILAVFTHQKQGAKAVTLLYRGTVRGLYSLSLFFFVLVWAWSQWGFWLSVGLATTVAITVQLIIQGWVLYFAQFKLLKG